ncbi:MAG: T9SS type A sorting domain-containing protein [Ignavibacteria bacterium]|nr:T9SS type A sorting domain-containing protein [Ignavibacteria bacterium]
MKKLHILIIMAINICFTKTGVRMKSSTVMNTLYGLLIFSLCSFSLAQQINLSSDNSANYSRGAVLQNSVTMDQVIIQLDDGVNFEAIGLTNGGTFEVSAQFTSTQTGQYAGWNLIEVQVYVNDVPIQATLKIYDTGTASTPGPLLYSAPFTPVATSWQKITLSNPVTISGNDIWVGYEVNHSSGTYPAGVDDGPAVPGGDWVYNGSWVKLHEIAPNLNYNWNIAAVLESPVPVELTSFNANTKAQNVILNWETATETNNQGFQIERQVGSKQYAVGNHWENIGYVAGFGTTTETKAYSFTDNEISSGSYIYRLKQIDFDGTFEYSDEIEVEVDFTPTEYALYQNYPNPFNPTTSIKYSVPVDGFVMLRVYNAIGEEIAELVNGEVMAGTYEINFDASALSSGIYFYKLEAGDPSTSSGQGFTETKKMLMIK